MSTLIRSANRPLPNIVLGNYDVPKNWPTPPKFSEPGAPPGPPIQWQPNTSQTATSGYGYVPAAEPEREVFFYHSDHLGSTAYITDRNGAVSQFICYMPYGEALVDEHSASTEEQPYKFNGKELARETGLYYYGARYYDPSKSGVWYGIDPLTEKYPALSPYSYCAGNPVKYVYPDGRVLGTAIGTIVGAIAGGVTSYLNNQDIWAGVTEGAISGLITGAAVDISIATAGTATPLLVVAVGITSGAAGGAVGGIVGDIAGQAVLQRENDNIVISTENFSNKAKTGAVSGAISGGVGGAGKIFENIAKTSTAAVQTTMSKSITETSKQLVEQGASQEAISTVTNSIIHGMGTAGKNSSNSLLKFGAATSLITETSLKIVNTNN